jgi:hypothetical protein
VPLGIGLQIATFIAVYATWGFANVRGIGWGWGGLIWLYSLVFYLPLDPIKFAIRYILSGRAWDNMLDSKVPPAFLKIKDRLDGFFQSSHHKIPLKKCFCGEQQFLVHIPCAFKYEEIIDS